MARSARFRSLERQLRLLRKYFLPARLDPTATYNPRQIALARAYRVLAHAEIEAYLEERVRSIAQDAVSKWKKTGQANRIILGLVAFSGKNMETPPTTLSPPHENQKKAWLEKIELNQKINSAVDAFSYALIKNHGIKEANILRLLIPIGISPDTLDSTWLADMNSFGEMRGEAAHLSPASPSVTNIPHPVEELATVKRLLAGLAEVDEEIDKLSA